MCVCVCVQLWPLRWAIFFQLSFEKHDSRPLKKEREREKERDMDNLKLEWRDILADL